MERIGIDNVTWQKMATLMFVLATGITLVIGGLMLYKLRTQRPDPLVRAYARFCAKLSRHGVTRHPSEGPLAFSRRASAMQPHLRELIEQISGLYMQLRYGPAASAPAPDTAMLLEKVRAFPAP